MGALLNTCVTLGYFVRITKRDKTPANVTLTLRIWHYCVPSVISNIFSKFDKEISRNGCYSQC